MRIFGRSAEIYSVNLRIQFECGKILTRKTPNTDTFNTMAFVQKVDKKSNMPTPSKSNRQLSETEVKTCRESLKSSSW